MSIPGTKTCPLCRAERGFTETMRLNGLHTFLKVLRATLTMEEDEPNGEQDAEN